jgi:protoporphyrin/coproporphyrin ferrochelatase
MTYGSPEGPDDMPRYLAAVRGGRPATAEVVAEFRRRYDAIGGSPLIPITQAQAAAVEQRMRTEGIDGRVTAGMRFSEPTIAHALRELALAGCDQVAAIIMSPQYSQLLMSGYQRTLAGAADELRDGTPEICLAPAWYRNDRFLMAVADRIREGLSRLPAAVRRRAPVLLTAHSVPRRVAEREPAYLEQLRETAELVAARAGLAPDRWRFCWQSAGHEPGEWMKPDFADLLPQLHREGHRSVLVAPIQFLSDHLEVLYDIDIAAREQAARAGLAFARIDSLNQHPDFVACLAEVALNAAQ